MQNVLKKSPNFPNHKTVKENFNNFKRQTTGINVSKEEMKSTNKMLEVLGKRLHQVFRCRESTFCRHPILECDMTLESS